MHSFEDTRPLARAVAEEMGAVHRDIELHHFPDGESRVRVRSAENARAAIVRSLDRPNGKFLEVLFAADALRRCGVEELVFVTPYLAYMRQDAVFRDGEALSQRVVGELLGRAFDEVVTVEAHLHRIRELSEVVPCRSRSISAAPIIGEWCRSGGYDVVVGPDLESEPWVRQVAEIAGVRWVVCEKIRSGDRSVEVEVPRLGDSARSALLVDDIASTGVTLVRATEKLRSRGIDRVDAAIVHALFDDAIATQLRKAGVERLVSTDTVAHASNAISVAGILAQELVSSPPPHPHATGDV